MALLKDVDNWLKKFMSRTCGLWCGIFQVSRGEYIVKGFFAYFVVRYFFFFV